MDFSETSCHTERLESGRDELGDEGIGIRFLISRMRIRLSFGHARPSGDERPQNGMLH